MHRINFISLSKKVLPLGNISRHIDKQPDISGNEGTESGNKSYSSKQTRQHNVLRVNIVTKVDVASCDNVHFQISF